MSESQSDLHEVQERLREERDQAERNRRAFPEEITQLNGGTGKYEHVGQSHGMTLREWYAGMALQGMLAHGEPSGTPEEYASDAFDFADAMIEASKRR
jgi:hypothetical protein